MAFNVDGVGKHFTEAQLNALKTVMGDEKQAQKLLDLFGTEDNDTKGFSDEAQKDLGFSAELIAKVAEADDVFKGLLDGSLTIEELEKSKADEKTDGTGKTDGKDGKVDGKTDKGVKSKEELKALEDEVLKLKKELDGIDEAIKTQKEKIETKTKELEEKTKELEEKEKALEEKKEKLAQEQKKLDDLKTLIEKKEKEKADTKKLIQEKQEQLITKAEETQAEAVKKAKDSYDEKIDGDWNAYLMKKLGDLNVDAGISSEITILTNKLTGIDTELGALNGQYSSQENIVAAANKDVVSAQGEVDTVKKEIANIQNDISTAENTIKEKEASEPEIKKNYDAKMSELTSAKAEVQASSKVKAPSTTTGIVPEGTESKLTQAEVTKKVPEKEFALVEKYGVDLGEKLADGSPRYIFAEGADSQYHIYDMGNGRQGATLARLYEPGNGFDIVPSGSGYLNGFQEATQGSGRPVYYFCGENIREVQGCYSTSSPLSFDLNGDGVKTSDEIVEFDIDGDGVVDKINNSADAVLVFDKDGDGISGEDGSECFGDNTDIDGDGVKDGYKDGFEALKAFARDKGLIDDKDDMVLDADDIKYLEENFGFGLKTEGYNSEAKSLTELGITEINLAKTDETKLEDDFDGKGNQLMTQQGATFVQDGKTKDYADIWHRKIDDEFAEMKEMETVDTEFKTIEEANKIKIENYDDNSKSKFLENKFELTNDEFAEMKKMEIANTEFKTIEEINKTKIEAYNKDSGFKFPEDKFDLTNNEFINTEEAINDGSELIIEKYKFDETTTTFDKIDKSEKEEPVIGDSAFIAMQEPVIGDSASIALGELADINIQKEEPVIGDSAFIAMQEPVIEKDFETLKEVFDAPNLAFDFTNIHVEAPETETTEDNEKKKKVDENEKTR